MTSKFALLFKRANTNDERIAQCKAYYVAFAGMFVAMMLLFTIANRSEASSAACAGMFFSLALRFASAQEIFSLRQELEEKLETLHSSIQQDQEK